MEFRLLGPLEVAEGGRSIDVGGSKQRAVLAHLLIRPGTVVSTDQLIDEVWGEQTPDAARKSLQAYVSRLRKALGDSGRLESRPAGYLLRAGPDEVDAQRFEALVRRARESAAEDPQTSLEALTEALGLWRGPAFADLADEPSLRIEIARLEEMRMQAIEDRAKCELALGRHDEAIAGLQTEVERHPLRERLWGLLLLALYRSGRQGDALAAYQRLRERLADDLGIDPSPEIRELHERILRQDAALSVEGRPLRGYRLLEDIGRGSFGVVYRATQPQVGRDVAIKVIRPDLANDPDFIRRFEAEAQMVAGVEHPHIVPLYDYWREPGGAYLVMRWLRAGSLADRLKQGPLPLDQLVPITAQVAGALGAAHSRGVIHRDVKPANILLDDEERAYLSDFGVAWNLEAGPPPSATTTGYLSPEQIRGEPPTERSDIYSLGVVLHEALTGRRPFGSEDPEELARLHLTEQLPPIAGQGIPPAVNDVIATATAKDPKDRFADAIALADAFHEAAATDAAPAATSRIRNPYKGLRPFLEADAADFFGRETLRDSLLGRLAETRLVAVVGPSGGGKSSIVRAGLVPALRAGALPGSESWFVAEMTPGDDPFAELALAVERISSEPSSGLMEELTTDDHALSRALERLLPEGLETLLLVDQFEEVFTLGEDEDRRRLFLQSMAVAVGLPSSHLRVVLTIRADFFDRPLRYPELAPLIRRGTEVLPPLAPEELERAIVRPAQRQGVSIRPELVRNIVRDVADQPGALPLLQYTLTELFERRADQEMTIEAYRAIGGISGALVSRAESLYGALDQEGQAASRQLLLRLVALGEGRQDTRRRVRRAQVLSLEGLREPLQAVIDAFGRHRLLSFDRDPVTREPTVEVAHEALLSAWGRLRGWIDAAREDLRVHSQVAGAAGEWEGSNRDPSFLARGARLASFERWAEGTELALSQEERAFLDASLVQRVEEEAAERERLAREESLQRRSVHRLRALVAVLATAALLAIGLTIFAFAQRREARDQAMRAERHARVATARELAGAAVASIDEDPERAILLALQAVETTRAVDGDTLKDAEEALHRAVQASRVVSTISGLFGIQFSPDGERVATSQSDGTARIWDPWTGEELLRLEGHSARTLSVDWSPDGAYLATSSEDGTAKVWDAGSGSLVRTFAGHEAGLRSPHFSPDGSVLATTSFDGTTRLWDVATGEQLLALEHTGGVEFSPDGSRLIVSDPPITAYDTETGHAVFTLGEDIPDPRDATWSSDGRTIAVSDGDGFAYVFDVRSRERLLTLTGHNQGSTVGEVVYSADDELLATSSSDGTVRVWEAQTGLEMLALPGLGGNVEGVAFSPDGTLVAGSSGSGVAKVWDITRGGSRELLTIPGHTDIVWGMGTAPDGSWLATGSVDGTAAIWDTETGRQVKALFGFQGARVEDLAVDPEGTRIVATSGEGAILLWDAATGETIRELQASGPPALGARFSPDGSQIVTGDVEGNAVVWEARTGARVRSIDAHDREIIAAIFSPDGRRIVTGSMDETAKVWDVETGEMLAHMRRHQDNINAAAFSADGSRLYTAGEDGVLKVWDAATGRELRAITGHAAGLLDVVVHPDGSRIVTAGRDGTARVWNPENGRELLLLAGHRSGASALAFSPEGDWLAVAGEDGSIRLLVLSIDDLVELARERLTRSFSNTECRQFLHGPCPES